MLKKGQAVSIKNTLLTGTVKKVEIVDDDQLNYLVGYTDVEGVATERFFTEDQLNAAAQPAAAKGK